MTAHSFNGVIQVPSVVSEASVSPHRAHHAKQASGSSKGKQPGGFEALLETAAPDAPPEKTPRADKTDKADKPEKPEPAVASRKADDTGAEPADPAAPPAETNPAPDATVAADATQTIEVKPDAATEVTALPPPADIITDTPQTETTDETAAAVVAAVVVQPVAQPVVAPVIAPTIAVEAAPAAEDTTDIPITGVKPAGETAPADPVKTAPQAAAPADAAAPEQIPQEAKPQIEKAAGEKPAADKPAVNKAKAQQPVADDNTADSAAPKDKDTSLAEKKAAPTEIAASAKPDAPAKPKADADGVRNELDLTPREHAAKTETAQTPTLTTTQTQSAHSTTTLSPANATQQSATAVPVAGLAVEIAAQARAGKSRFEIRLDPPELGRIDVRLDMDKDGNVTSRMIVERAETLDLLRRDAQQLERALNQAGLKTADNAMQFQLRDQGFAQNGGDNSRNGKNDASQVIIPDDQSPVLDAARGYGRLLGLGNGLDISV